MKYILSLAFSMVVFNGSNGQAVNNQTRTADSTIQYSFTGHLIETVPFPPLCGTIAWATVHKFEVYTTDYPGYSNKYVLLILPCPEFYGKEFFKKGAVYEIKTTKNNTAPFGYHILNKYQKEKTPLLWTQAMTRRGK